MLRVRIEDADHESFRKMLPKRGTVVRTFQETSNSNLWCLVRLDEPFEWQHKIGEPFQCRLLKVDHLLVASRWIGVNIGGPEPTSVFIALVDEGFIPTGEVLDIRRYVFIAWGMCHTERD